MERERKEARGHRHCLDGWKRRDGERDRLQCWNGLAESSRADSGSISPGRGFAAGPNEPAANQGRTRNANSGVGAYSNIDAPSDIDSDRNSKINAEGDAKTYPSADAETNPEETRREGFTNSAALDDTARKESS